jgi:hypothetical protein
MISNVRMYRVFLEDLNLGCLHPVACVRDHSVVS